jgi:Transition state regulatory protein AbrB
MAEMTIISYALGIETAFVVTSQVCRSFFVLTFAPILFRLLGIRAGPGVPAQGRPKLGAPDGSKSRIEPRSTLAS